MTDSFALTGTLLSVVLAVVVYVWTALALAAVFRKMGEEPWQGWVPVLNMVVLLRLGGMSPWLLLLLLVPVLGAVAVWVVVIMAAHEINRSFGMGTGMTVLAALLFVIWASVLGFGTARWIGAGRATAETAAAPLVGGWNPPPLPTESPGPRRSSAPAEPAVREETAAPAPAPAAERPPIDVPTWAPPATPPPPVPPASTSPAEPASAEPATSDAAHFAAPPSDAPRPPTIVVPTRGYADLDALDDDAVDPDDRVGPVRRRSSADGMPSFDDDPRPDTPPVTRVPASAAPAARAEPWAPRGADDGFTESSEAVSAVVGAPDAGSPRSARSSVSAQHTRPEVPEDDDDLVEETIIARRRRVPWSLILPGGTPVDISSEVVILGRRPSPDPAHPLAQLVSIPDETRTVSKTHARLELRSDAWFITDLGSTNGVLFATLMGTEIEAEPGQELEAGERFFLGDAEVRLRRSEA